MTDAPAPPSRAASGAAPRGPRLRGVRIDPWLAAIVVVAAALRFTNLATQSFWFDEAQAVHEMQSSFSTMWHLWSAGEPNPPLYFLIAWPWARVFGTGEAGLRSLSAVLGTATIPILYAAGRELVSRRAGLIAAALAAINPFLIWYSQEAREYMLLTFLSAASLLLFARMWRAGSRRALIGWTVAAALALLTQYFAGFLVAAEALALLYRFRTRAMAAALAVLVVVEAALIPHLAGHAAHPAGWIDAFSLPIRIQQVPVAFALNTLYKSHAVAYGLIGAAVIAAALIALLIIGAPDAQLRGAGIAAGLAAAVLVVPLLVALAGRDYYEARALIGGWIPLAVVLGAACAAPRARIGGAMLGLVLAAGSLYGWAKVQYGPAVYRRPDWAGVARALGPARTTRAITAVDGNFAAPSLTLYLPGVRWTGSGQIPEPDPGAATVSELDVVADEGAQLQGRPPRGVRLIGTHTVGDYVTFRFALRRPTSMAASALEALGARLIGQPDPLGAILIQRPPSLR